MTQFPSDPERTRTTTPRWIQWLLGRAASAHRVEEALGDIEETHRRRVHQRGRMLAVVLTAIESGDLTVALLRERFDQRRVNRPTRGQKCTQMRQRLWLVSRLDFTLGLRMVARYPSLTAVAVLAMAFGIATGATAFELLKRTMFPPLPYNNAARIVVIQNVNVATARTDTRVLHDFEQWRVELKTIRNLSALYLRKRNLIVDQGAPLPVSETQVSAAAFRLLDRAPILGRSLIPADETAEAAPIAVLSYDLWQKNFAGARDVVGKIVRIGDQPTTVIGVMPRGFSFFVPRASLTIPAPQDLWVPMRLRARDYAGGEGPGITVFGELSADITADKARTELAIISARFAAASPQTHQYLSTQLLSFALPFSGNGALFPTVALTLGTVFIAALMVVMCGNVALLLFARAATREREIVIRSALGASRGSIVAQLFAEALVLATIAVLVGLAGATVALKWAIHSLASMLQAEGLMLPSWTREGLSPATIAYAAGLAVLGAAVAGILPGLKVTGKQGHMGTQRLVGGGGSSVRLGGVWTAIIITQVALTAMLVPIAIVFGIQTREVRNFSRTLPSGNFLSVRLGLDGDADVPALPGAPVSGTAAALTARFEQSYRTLAQRLSSEPGVSGVTVARQLPGSMHEARRFQIDAPGHTVNWEQRVQIASVDVNFFEVLRTPISAGRTFIGGDSLGSRRSVIVNESFVREHLGGLNAIGHQVRYRDNTSPNGAGVWYTIVGVARDVAMTIDPAAPSNAGIYHVLQSGAHNVELAVQLTGNPTTFIARLHELAAEAGPVLRINRVIPLDQAGQGLFIAHDAWFRVVVLCGLMAILLTNAGIYAVISFTVARRTREIGVRVALGAQRSQVVAVVLARAARHVGIGVGIGAAFGSVLVFTFKDGGVQPTFIQSSTMLASYVGFMMIVCLVACVVPTSRALRIEPTVALAAEG